MRTTLSTPPIGLALADILPEAQAFGAGEVRAISCTSDADSVRPGDVFFAIDEGDCDGHELASRAIKRGAKALVVERPLPHFGVAQFVVEDSRVAYGEFCQRLVGSPSDQLPTIGIAGSAGKTSTASLLRAILFTAGKTPGHVAGNELSDGMLTRSDCQGRLTAPALATWLARMTTHDCSHAVLEVTSDLLRRRVTSGITLDVACFTNIDSDSREPSRSLAASRRTMSAVMELLPANGVAVLNGDDPSCAKLLATLDTPAITFGMKRPAEITAKLVSRNANEQTFVLSTGTDFAAVRTTIIGDSHIYNCLAAAAVAAVYDIDLTTIARGLESVSRLSGVMQRIDAGQDFCAYVDRARSSRSLADCLTTAREVTRGRVITVLRESTGAPSELFSVAEKLSDVIVNSPNRDRDPTAAIAQACLQAVAGDVVIVAGPEQRVRGDQGQSWNDAEVVQELLRQMPVA